ncbi:hypothetical protein [Acinetobacter dispersus]|uniref:hypothetical protein n=1 Tax=Acinetobacter dispersus TaxID=70348 RepID=UPI00132ECF53|nr:hypothetical protein [Acinetobacter dispersus]QHH98854.1 hypothetical protein FPL17_15390 [Acinetobacter dispersus]
MNEKSSNMFTDLIENFNTRELLFTWYIFGEPTISGLQPHDIDSVKKSLINFCKSNFLDISLFNKLKNDIENNFIEEKNFNWIDIKDTRLLSYLLESIYHLKLMTISIYNKNIRTELINDKIKTSSYTPLINNTINLGYGRNQLNILGFYSPPYQNISFFSNDLYLAFIYHIDVLSLAPAEKIKLIDTIRKNWEQTINNLNLKKWLQKEDEMQIEWCWHYLHKHNKNMSIFLPYFESDLYNKVLILIDKLNFSHPSEKKIFLDTMRKTWSQKKFRESNKTKKPYHLPLTKMTHSKLEDLAKLKNISKEEVIEQLVMKEYSNFTDQNGKFKY